jgi:hypothetical protein
MEGVTILSTGTAMLGIGWGAAIILALIVFAIDYVFDPLDEEFGWRIGFASFVSIVTFIILAIFCVDTTEVTEYKVTIDDSVKYVEFTEKYEVVDQEGEIYTVRERMRSGD